MTGEPMHTASKEKNNTAPQLSIIVLKVEYPYVSYVQPITQHYTALLIKNCSKSTSAIKVATTKKNMEGFRYEEKPSCYRQIDTFLLSAKMNGTQSRTLVSS